MIRAVYITNGAFDAVVVPDGTYLDVTPEVMQHFLEAEENGDDFSDWQGLNDWPIEEKTGDHDDDIWEAAQQLGDIIAYYDDNKLIIRDRHLWRGRLEFFGVL